MTRPAAASPPGPRSPPRALENYYRLHARIYDATRWSFLFGRTEIIVRAAAVLLPPAPVRILEVGCGTGRNLLALARRYPRAHLTGVDLSAAMLAVAARKTAGYGPRVHLRCQAYDSPLEPGGHDLVVCSYALSMFNPGFDRALAALREDLAPGGRIALVDFHDTAHPWFARWMRLNHVRMAGQLRPLLHALFTPVTEELRPAYGGLWRYLLFIGQRSA